MQWIDICDKSKLASDEEDDAIYITSDNTESHNVAETRDNELDRFQESP